MLLVQVSLEVGPSMIFLPPVGCPIRVVFPWLPHLIYLTLLYVVSTLNYCPEAIQSVLTCSSKGRALYVDIYLMCPGEKVSLGSSYTIILD